MKRRAIRAKSLTHEVGDMRLRKALLSLIAYCEVIESANWPIAAGEHLGVSGGEHSGPGRQHCGWAVRDAAEMVEDAAASMKALAAKVRIHEHVEVVESVGGVSVAYGEKEEA